MVVEPVCVPGAKVVHPFRRVLKKIFLLNVSRNLNNLYLIPTAVMNTLLARLNAVFAYTLSVMAVLTLLCFASTYFNDNLATVQIQTGNAVV